LGFVLITASADAQIAQVKGGYRFRTQYHNGQVIRLETAATAGNVGSAAKGMVIKIPVTLSVKGVSKGVAHVKFDIGRGTMNGQSFSEAHSTMVELDSVDSSAVGGAKFPIKPIQPGDTWKAMRPVQLGGGQPMTLDGVYRFQGVTVKDGHTVAVITFDMKGAANGRGTMWLLTGDGTLYRSEMTISVPAVDSMSGLKVTMTRVPEQTVVHKPHK
jgi:hypothetical protein